MVRVDDVTLAPAVGLRCADPGPALLVEALGRFPELGRLLLHHLHSGGFAGSAFISIDADPRGPALDGRRWADDGSPLVKVTRREPNGPAGSLLVPRAIVVRLAELVLAPARGRAQVPDAITEGGCTFELTRGVRPYWLVSPHAGDALVLEVANACVGFWAFDWSTRIAHGERVEREGVFVDGGEDPLVLGTADYRGERLARCERPTFLALAARLHPHRWDAPAG